MAERPEDLNLPHSVITRIMKESIPEGISISKEARNAVSKAASVFVLYATSCANNYALKGKRKTLNAADVFAAMKDMEFEEFIEPLEKCLQEFRQEQKEKKEASDKRKLNRSDGEKAEGEESEQNVSSEMEDNREGEEAEEEVDDDDIDDENEEEDDEEEEEEEDEDEGLDPGQVAADVDDDVQEVE